MHVGFKSLVLPHQLNQHGIMFGGEIYAAMDIAAGNILRAYTSSTFLTYISNNIKFLAPIKAGTVLTIKGTLSKKGGKSATVTLQGYIDGTDSKCIEGDFIFVAIDENKSSTEFSWMTSSKTAIERAMQ